MTLRKKNIYTLVAIFFFIMSMFSGCSKNKQDERKDGSKVVTVTSTFLQDMVSRLTGDICAIELIIPAGSDPHVYVAQPGDLRKLERADLILYQGLYFEGKMHDILEKIGVAVTRHLDENQLFYIDEGNTRVFDPHFWFDIALYKEVVKTTAQDLIELMPEHTEHIKARETAYQAELDALHARCVEAMNSIPPERRFVVTPHDAFNYFARSYNITVIAPQGISTDSEVGAKDIEDTVNCIVAQQIPAIFVESTTNPDRMAKLQESARAKGWDVKVVSGEGRELYSDSLAPRGQPADTFLEMYWHNVQLISKNLADF